MTVNDYNIAETDFRSYVYSSFPLTCLNTSLNIKEVHLVTGVFEEVFKPDSIHRHKTKSDLSLVKDNQRRAKENQGSDCSGQCRRILFPDSLALTKEGFGDQNKVKNRKDALFVEDSFWVNVPNGVEAKFIIKRM